MPACLPAPLWGTGTAGAPTPVPLSAGMLWLAVRLPPCLPSLLGCPSCPAKHNGPSLCCPFSFRCSPQLLRSLQELVQACRACLQIRAMLLTNWADDEDPLVLGFSLYRTSEALSKLYHAASKHQQRGLLAAIGDMMAEVVCLAAVVSVGRMRSNAGRRCCAPSACCHARAKAHLDRWLVRLQAAFMPCTTSSLCCC